MIANIFYWYIILVRKEVAFQLWVSSEIFLVFGSDVIAPPVWSGNKLDGGKILLHNNISRYRFKYEKQYIVLSVACIFCLIDIHAWESSGPVNLLSLY